MSEEDVKGEQKCTVGIKKQIFCLKVLKHTQRLVVFVVCLFFFIVQTVKCVQFYYSYPTYVSSRLVNQWDAVFPAFTVCAEGDSYKEDVLRTNGVEGKNGYVSSKEDKKWSSNQSSVSPQQLFEESTFQVSDLFSYYKIRCLKANSEGQQSFTVPINQTNDLVHFEDQRHRPFGRCYTTHPKPPIKKLGIYYIKIYFARPVKLYLHAPGQFLDISGRMGMKVYPNQTVQSQINFQDVRMLQKDPTDGGFQCEKLHYDSCIYGRVTNLMKTATGGGCTVPYVLENNNICKDKDDIDTAFDIHWNHITNQKNTCPNPCEFLVINAGAKNYKTMEDSESRGLLYFYFAPRIMISQEHYLYPILSLLAEIGGYLGLLLGLSIFQGSDVIANCLDGKIEKIQKQDPDWIDHQKTLSNSSINSKYEKRGSKTWVIHPEGSEEPGQFGE